MKLNIVFDLSEAKSFYAKFWLQGSSLDRVFSESRNTAVSLRSRKFYQSGAGSSEKNKLWRDCREVVEDALAPYKAGDVDENEHVSRITEMAELLSLRHADVLADGRMLFGATQKYYNLALKCLWVLGEIEEPPHIPVDSIIAINVGDKGYSWTQSDDKEAYMSTIARCKEVSCCFGLSLAQWELLYWNMTALPSKI